MPHSFAEDNIIGLETQMRVLEKIFCKKTLYAPLDLRFTKFQVLSSNNATRTHNLRMRAKFTPFDLSGEERTYIIQIRPLTTGPDLGPKYEKLSRPLLGSLVPERKGSGEMHDEVLGDVRYVVYMLPKSQDQVESLAVFWRDMSLWQRKSVVQQVMDARKKLCKITISEQSTPLNEDEGEVTEPVVITHPSFEPKMDEYRCVLPTEDFDSAKWSLDGTQGRGNFNVLLKALGEHVSTQASAHYMYHSKGDEDIYDVVRISPSVDVDVGERVEFEREPRELFASNLNLRLQHCSLSPESLLVVKSKRASGHLPSKYQLFAILDWHEARFAPLGVDIALQDTRLGCPGGDEIDGSYYERFRQKAFTRSLCKIIKDAKPYHQTLRLFLEAAHMLSSDPIQRTTGKDADFWHAQYAREKWMHEHHLVWAGVGKGYRRKLVIRSPV